MKLLEVTAVLCVRNSEAYLQRCLNGLARNGVDRVIVVDGLSTDSTTDIALSAGCVVLSDEGRGFVAARRMGVEAATSEFVLILGPDDWIMDGAVQCLLDYLQIHTDAAAAQCSKFVQVNNSTYFDRGMNFYYSQVTLGPVPVVGTPSLYRRQLLIEFPYDILLPSNDDTDWCYQVAGRGFHVARVQQALSCEIESFDFRSFRRRWVWYGRGDFELMRRGFEGSRRRRLRHLFHPAREYGGRLVLLSFRRRKFQYVPYFLMCMTFRYEGFIRGLLSAVRGSHRPLLVGR